MALRPSWSPAGNWIAFSSTRGGPLNLWGVPFESDPPGLTGPPKRLTTGIGEDVGVAVAPDGAAVVYAGLHTAPDVWMLDTASGALTQITSETTTEDYPRVSPDGTRLLFFSNRSGEEQLWMQDLATGELQQVSRGNARQSAWSPDGNRVAYGTEQGLVIQDLSTGEVTVVGLHLLASSPLFSPDGREVAFHGRDQRPPGDVYFPVRRSQLYRVEVEDASTLRLIPTPEGDPSDLTWSADGRTIFFGVDLLGGVSLWAVDLATAAFRQIPTQLTDVRHATVSPDGTLILFVHEHRDLYVMPTWGESRDCCTRPPNPIGPSISPPGQTTVESCSASETSPETSSCCRLKDGRCLGPGRERLRRLMAVRSSSPRSQQQTRCD